MAADNVLADLCFETTQTVRHDPTRIADLLTGAFEGGSNYWYGALGVSELPPGLTKWDFKLGGLASAVLGGYYHWSVAVPLLGGTVSMTADGFTENEGDRITFSRGEIQRGLDLFGKVAPCHLADWLEENDDADTGDVFLQLCLFGEVVYG